MRAWSIFILPSFIRPWLDWHELEINLVNSRHCCIFARLKLNVLALLHVRLVFHSQISKLIDLFHQHCVFDFLPQDQVNDIIFLVLNVDFSEHWFHVNVGNLANNGEKLALDFVLPNQLHQTLFREYFVLLCLGGGLKLYSERLRCAGAGSVWTEDVCIVVLINLLVNLPLVGLYHSGNLSFFLEFQLIPISLLIFLKHKPRKKILFIESQLFQEQINSLLKANPLNFSTFRVPHVKNKKSSTCVVWKLCYCSFDVTVFNAGIVNDLSDCVGFWALVYKVWGFWVLVALRIDRSMVYLFFVEFIRHRRANSLPELLLDYLTITEHNIGIRALGNNFTLPDTKPHNPIINQLLRFRYRLGLAYELTLHLTIPIWQFAAKS